MEKETVNDENVDNEKTDLDMSIELSDNPEADVEEDPEALEEARQIKKITMKNIKEDFVKDFKDYAMNIKCTNLKDKLKAAAEADQP